jgi:hypothetical protein
MEAVVTALSKRSQDRIWLPVGLKVEERCARVACDPGQPNSH